MDEMTGSGEDVGGAIDEGRVVTRKRVETQYFSTARTAPRAAGESRIGTDEAHERLQAARYRALRDHRFEDAGAEH